MAYRRLTFISFYRVISILQQRINNTIDMAKMEHSSGFSGEASDDGEELRMPPPPLDWELNCLLTHLNQEMTKDDLDSAKALFQGLFINILTCFFFQITSSI